MQEAFWYIFFHFDEDAVDCESIEDKTPQRKQYDAHQNFQGGLCLLFDPLIIHRYIDKTYNTVMYFSPKKAGKEQPSTHKLGNLLRKKLTEKRNVYILCCWVRITITEL